MNDYIGVPLLLTHQQVQFVIHDGSIVRGANGSLEPQHDAYMRCGMNGPTKNFGVAQWR